MAKKKPDDAPPQVDAPSVATIPSDLKKKATQLLKRNGKNSTAAILRAGTATLAIDLGYVVGTAKLLSLGGTHFSIITFVILWLSSIFVVCLLWLLVFLPKGSSQ